MLLALIRQGGRKYHALKPVRESNPTDAWIIGETDSEGCIEPPGKYYLCRDCDCDQEAEPLSGVEIQHDKNVTRQKLVLFASVPLSDEKWLPFAQNQLIIARDGHIIDQPDLGNTPA